MTKPTKTGHATFDRQWKGQYVGTGNVFSNVQTSSFIRPRTETACNGTTFAPGALRDYDLRTFSNGSGLPHEVRTATLAATEGESAILYRFQHSVGERRVVHGYVLTKTDARSHELIAVRTTGPTRKSMDVITAMVEIVSNPPMTREKVDTELKPIAAMNAVSMLRATGRDAGTIERIASRITGSADEGRDGDLWRGWTAVIEDRALWAKVDRPGVSEAIRSCNEIANSAGADAAERIRTAMRSIEAAAMATAEGLTGHRSEGLRLADAAIRGIAARAAGHTSA